MSAPFNIETIPLAQAEPLTSKFGMIISARFSVTGFANDWRHCHQMANYLARFASANEGDPERHATLLSTFFNEVLEVLFRHHASEGQIAISFQRRNGRILLKAVVPVDEQNEDFYKSTIELVNQPDPLAWYRDRLERAAEEGDDQALGLLELAAVYGSVFTVSKTDDDSALLLSVDFPLESEESEET